MNFARTLYERFRQLIHEFAKFGVIGVLGLVITNGCYDVLHNKWGVGPVTSTTIATIVATIVSYLGNRYWSFRHRERTGVVRESVVFFVLNGVGLLIQDAAVAVNYYLLGLSSNKAAGFVALNVGIVLATLFRFWSYRKFVWAAPAATPPGTAAGRSPSHGPPFTPQETDGAAAANGHALHARNGHAAHGQGGQPGAVPKASHSR